MRISNYATDEFDEAFSAINEEIDAADKREEEMLAKANTEPAEVIDMFESVDDVINKELTDKNGEPNPYAPLYAETEETGVSTEVKTLSMLQQQIDSRRDEFAKSMNNLFKEIVDKYPEQAEILYFIAVEIALDANDKDAMKLAQAIDADPRDVIMADYEYKLRIKDKDLNDLKAKTN